MNRDLLNSIAPSKDTLFLRGFSYRQHIENIREFFNRSGARNSVEFFKDDGSQLYIALRFESRDVAKDILARYNNKEILGDRVAMTYYKDLRRVRVDQFRRPMGPRHGNDEYDYNRYVGRNDRRNDYGGWRGSDSYSGGRNRTSGGGWLGGHSGQQQVIASRTRRYTRSSSHSRSPSVSRSNTRSSSSSAKPSPAKRKRKQRSTSGERRNRSPKHQSGQSKHHTGAAHSSQSPGRKSSDWMTNEERQKSGGKGDMRIESLGQEEGTEDQSGVGSDWKMGGGDTSEAAVDESQGELEEGERKDESSVDGGARIVSDGGGDSSAPLPPLSAMSRGQRGALASSSDKKRKVNVQNMNAEDDKQDNDLDNEVVSHNIGKVSKNKKQNKDGGRQQAVVEEEHSSDNDHTEDDKIVAGNRGGRAKAKDAKDDDHRDNTAAVAAGSRRVMSGKDLVLNDDDGDGRSAVKRKKQPAAAVVGAAAAAASVLSDGEASDADPSDDIEHHSSHKHKKGDVNTNSRGHVESRHVAAMSRRTRADINSASGKEIEKNSTQGLSQQKLALIREKKDEIERAYRQDCETFATVAKMLISKDQDLEYKIQKSLSENLKDIGQRCILELREFVERLKAEDDFI